MSLFNMKNSKDKKTTKGVVKPPLRIILASPGSTGNAYLTFLERRYELQILNINKLENHPDLILFTGGADVNPDLYGENVGARTSLNKKRDEQENKIYYDFSNVPKLGICRGSQFLTVMNGGKLVQHVDNHANGNHSISVSSKKLYTKGTFDITSTHHQMMNPFNLDSDRFELIAWSKYFRSPNYLNGDNEQMEVPDGFLEPEIVFYPQSRSLCIQGHPEMGGCPEETKDLCLELIDNYLVNVKK